MAMHLRKVSSWTPRHLAYRFRLVTDGVWVEIFERWHQADSSSDLAIAAGESTAADVLSPEARQFSNLLPEKVSPARRNTFALGRLAAQRAAARLGHELTDLPIGNDGQPVWPAGLVGSIAHTRERGVSLVGRSSSISSLGIDIEQVAPSSDIEWLVAFDSELDWVADGDSDRRTVEIFSAKEAIFKAYFPSIGVRFGFDAVRLEVCDKGPTFVGRFIAPVAAGHQIGKGIEVWTRWRHDVVVSWVVLKS